MFNICRCSQTRHTERDQTTRFRRSRERVMQPTRYLESILILFYQKDPYWPISGRAPWACGQPPRVFRLPILPIRGTISFGTEAAPLFATGCEKSHEGQLSARHRTSAARRRERRVRVRDSMREAKQLSSRLRSLQPLA